MQDRPDAVELLDAVRTFLEEQVVPVLEGMRQFHARVAVNVLAIVGREFEHGEKALLAEWHRLVELLGMNTAAPPPSGGALRESVQEFNRVLVERIRAGAADDGSWGTTVLAHLRAAAAERLAIANPGYVEPRVK